MEELHLPRDWQLRSRGQVCTGGHCWHFHGAGGPHPALRQQRCPRPLLCTCLLLCNCILHPAKRKGNGTGYVAAGSGMAHLIGEIIKGFAFTTCQRPPFTDHGPHSCVLLALFVCSWPICYFHLLFFFFKFTSYVLKSNPDPIAPFLSLLYAAYLVWKTEGLAPSTC